MNDFPNDIHKNKQKWLEEWGSICTIYKPHLPDMLQLLKLTLPSDMRDKVIKACKIPRDPIEVAEISSGQAQRLQYYHLGSQERGETTSRF